MLRVTVPTPELAASVRDCGDADVYVWDLRGPTPRKQLDLVVMPYMSAPEVLDVLRDVDVRVIQSQMVGYDGVTERIPEGVTFCNAAGVHEASTAELAVGMMIACLRELPEFIRAQDRREWQHRGTRALADSVVLILGAGGVGRAVADRLAAFETTTVRIGRTSRYDQSGEIVGLDQLHVLLPAADIVVLALPLTAETTGLVDAAFLGQMKIGALLVNVGRGGLVATDALVEAVASGRVRAALDVVDPEPLPRAHPLWLLDGVLLTPHVGGHSSAMGPRIERLIQRQITALRAGEAPLNTVIEPTP